MGASVIAFAGDAITCWFQADKGRRAVTCAQAMQQAMQQFSRIQLADGTTVALAVKVGIACGPTRRFVVGDPKIQVLDVLAGSTLSEMAAAAHLAGRGDIIASGGVAQQLGPDALVMESRKGDTEEEFFVLQGCRNGAAAEPWPELPDLGEAVTRPWLIRAVFERLRAGQGEFLTELRPAVAIFVKFGG